MTQDKEQFFRTLQQLQVDGITGRMSCKYCYYKDEAQTLEDYRKCELRNSCNGGEWPWAALDLLNQDEIWYAKDPINSPNEAYVPSRIVRQVRVIGQPRYVKLVSCHLEGYHCNRLCHFYEQRIQDHRTASSCSKSRGCGYNGSFYSLLIPANLFFKKCLEWSINENAKPTATLNNNRSVYMKRMRVQNITSTLSAYVIDVYDMTTDELLTPAVIMNADDNSGLYGFILDNDNLWVEDLVPAFFNRIKITPTTIETKWWLMYMGIPEEKLNTYPEQDDNPT